MTKETQAAGEQRDSVSYEDLYLALKDKVEEYVAAIKDVGFAVTEYQRINGNPRNPAEVLEAVCSIIDTSKELNYVVEQSPSSIYVADAEANTLRINKAFEELTETKREALLGRNTSAIEGDRIFDPSVVSLALKEGRRVVVHQKINNEKEFVTAGVPVLNEKGEIFRVITNALLSEDVANMSSYLRRKEEQASAPKQTERMIAASSQMQEILRLADVIKNTESTVIIEGETGVGKSMLARYIHNTSSRADKRMTEINCGAIPPQLLESELFGYVSGAFTGADKKGKPGLIEISEGGTILLDEVSELPLFLQVKLLHFLQEKKITRVGGTQEIRVNVRVIAATNRRLEALVERGEFREDLYYRLNVVPIIVPPLRERKADIMPAVTYFVEKYTKLYNKSLPLDQKCVDFFQNNSWKGNLRELENCIERLVVTEGTVALGKGEPVGGIRPAAARSEPAPPPVKTMTDMEKDLIMDAYSRYGSSYKVAEALGISQSTAYRRIRKYTREAREKE